MSNVAKLKKKAAEFELKKQFDKAVAVYVELLEQYDQHAHELDVALFNRVGDILLRQGNVADAVDYYEQAVDHYAEGGFFNNAIALCNKILRHSPGRASVYYKLGKISAQKGFKSDAKQNFLEYADRMQKGGKLDEAFRALKEFADLCPDQDDIRLMLAEQLSKAERKGEAIEQLQLLYERYDSEGRSVEAGATVERMKAIDPTAEPRTGGGARRQTTQDLVFLDLSDEPSPPPRRPTAAPPIPAGLADLPIVGGLPSEPERKVEPPKVTEPAPPPVEPPPAFPEIPDVVQSTDFGQGNGTGLTAEPLSGLQTSQLDGTSDLGATGSLLDMEPTAFGAEAASFDAPSFLDEPLISRDVQPSGFDLEPVEASDIDLSAPPVQRSATPTHGHEAVQGGDLDFILPDSFEAEPRTARSSGEILADLEPPILRTAPPASAPTAPPEPAEESHAAQLGDMPLLDFELPAPAPRPAPRPSAPVPELTLAEDLDANVAAAAEEAARAAKEAERRAAEIAASSPPVELIEDVETPDAIALDAIELDIDAQLGPVGDVEPAPPAVRRSSTMFAAQSVEILQASVEGEPENWALRRELAEAMLDAGDRDGGIRELEVAMTGAERSNDLDLASRIADEIARIDPGTIKHLQKRVEYAFRTNDKPRLIEAYLALGEALGTEQVDKARAVYQRVLDLAPDDIRAQAALEALPQPEPEPPRAAPPARRASAARKATPPRPQKAAPAKAIADESFVNLGDLLRDEVGPADTRMVVDEHEPTGDEEADFQDMLRKFKQGIAQNVEQEDYQSHYDLGIAFKEMGLLDEAIAEFQKALRAPTNRVPTYEALGQCFIEKEQFPIASTVLSRALNEDGMTDDQLVGVLYLLGRAAEALNRWDEALSYYQRVFLVDIQFRDVAERINDVERAVR